MKSEEPIVLPWTRPVGFAWPGSRAGGAPAWWVPLLLVPLLTSCLVSRDTKNEPLDPAVIAGLQPGVTTARELVEALGAPTEVVQLGRRSAYRYDFVTSKEMGLLALIIILINKDTRSDRLWVFFDEQEVLTHLGKTFAAEHAEYAMPWSDLPEGVEEQ